MQLAKVCMMAMVLLFSAACSVEHIEPSCPEIYHYIPEGYSSLLPTQSQSFLSIWKRQHYRLNNLSDDEFGSKFLDFGFSSYGGSDTAILFRVDYIIEWEWFEVQHYDEFYIFVTDLVPQIDDHPVPRNEMLQEEWIAYMIDSNLLDRPFSKLNLKSEVNYGSCIEALEELRTLSGAEALGFHDIAFWVELKEPEFDGFPYLVAIDQDDQDTSLCTYGWLNLVNGEWGIEEETCRLIN